MSYNLTFIFSQTALVGAFQAFTLAIVILSIKRTHLSTILLVSYVAIHGLRLLLLYFLYGEIPIQRQEIFVLLASGFALGPILYFYTCSLTQGDFKWGKRQWLHLLPVPLSIFVSALPRLRQPGVEENIYVWFNVEQPMMLYYMDWVLPLLLNLSIVVYSVLSVGLLIRHQQRILELFSSIQTVSLRWLWIVLGLSVLAALLSSFAHLMRFLFEAELGPRLYIWMIVNLIQLFVIAIMGLRQQLIFSSWEQQIFADANTTVSEQENLTEEQTEPVKYRKSGLGEQASLSHWQTLETHMQSERPYLSCTLNLKELADAVQIPVDHLSQVINTHSAGKFYDYVNGYRLDEAQRILQNDPTKPLLDVALESGFSSQSVFSTRFKKSLSISPSEYRKQQLHHPGRESGS